MKDHIRDAIITDLRRQSVEGDLWVQDRAWDEGDEDFSVDGSVNLAELVGAILLAMRDPTHRMTVAGHSALDDTEYTQTKALGSLMGRLAFVDVWQAMIDAALQKDPGR